MGWSYHSPAVCSRPFHGHAARDRIPGRGHAMRGLWARLAVVAITAIGALALAVPLASADSRVPNNSTSVGPLQVHVYSQMCDGLNGAKLHTRLNVKNTSSKAQSVTVVDPFAKVVYDPPGPIQPGRGTLVHLTSSRHTPAHTVTVRADNGATAPVSIAKSPCPPPTSEPTTNPTTDTTKPTGTTKGTTVTTGGVPPTDPGGGPPVGSPGEVGASGIVATPASTSAAKAASGTLPFTGSDIRGFALIGDLMVLIGFAMLLISHRSPRMSAFLKRLSPKRLSLHRAS